MHAQTPPHVSRAKEIVYTAPDSLDTSVGLRAHIERYQTNRTALAALPFSSLPHDAQVDHVLLTNIIKLDLRRLQQVEDRMAEALPLLPFAPDIFELIDNRIRVEPPDSPKIAANLFRLEKQIAGLRKEIPSRKGTVKPTIANRAARLAREFSATLKEWNTFYNGYDPNFSCWTAEPLAKLNKAIDTYAADLREKLAGVPQTDLDTILGDPIGDAALRDELRF